MAVTKVGTLWVFFLLISHLSYSLPGKVSYVSVNGTPQGNGSRKNPWDLQTALNQPPQIKPGDTIYIDPGIYRGTFISNLTGTVDKPIIFKNNSGGRVIIDGNRAKEKNQNVTAFRIKGAYTWYYGFEVTNSDPVRTIFLPGSNPSERRGTGVEVFGPGVKIINFIIHDTGQGIGAWKTAIDAEFYGNIIFNNGWNAPDRMHGHGIYSQNSTGMMSYIDNIIFNNFGYGWHIYGSEKAELKNYYLEGNIMFNDDWLIGGKSPLRNIELNTNFSYKNRPQLGYNAALNDSLLLTNNYFPSGIAIYWWKNVTAKGNQFFNVTSASSPIYLRFSGSPDLSTYHFADNEYPRYNSLSSSKSLSFSWTNTAAGKSVPGRSGKFSLKDWQAKGQDKEIHQKLPRSQEQSKLPNVGNEVFFRQNKYDGNRAMIIVYNWDHLNKISLAVPAFLSNGDTFELHNAADYFGDIITVKCEGGKILIPMKEHTSSKPLGYANLLGPETFPEFGVFILVKAGK